MWRVRSKLEPYGSTARIFLMARRDSAAIAKAVTGVKVGAKGCTNICSCHGRLRTIPVPQLQPHQTHLHLLHIITERLRRVIFQRSTARPNCLSAASKPALILVTVCQSKMLPGS